jgi:predicted nucleotidyltransferase component of viral defense system
MIPESHIRDWKQKAPWNDWAKVEQDLLVSRAVVEIFRHPVLSGCLVFRGGTALHKLYFQPPQRYSEDVDMVQIEAGPIGPVFDALREVLNPFLGKPQRKQGPGVVTLTYRATSEISPVVPLKLKVEINSREHFSVFPVEKKTFAVDSPWFQGTTDIPVFSLDELLATKLRALYQRRKGRDLFDLWLGLTAGKADPDRVVEAFRRYLEHSGHPISRSEFAANLAEKRNHSLFKGDLTGLLPDGCRYDPEDGFEIIEQKIVPRL